MINEAGNCPGASAQWEYGLVPEFHECTTFLVI